MPLACTAARSPAARRHSRTRWPASARSAAVANAPLLPPRIATFTGTLRDWACEGSHHDAVPPQRRQALGWVVEQLAQHRVRVLPESSGRHDVEAELAIDLDRGAERGQRAVHRVLDLC